MKNQNCKLSRFSMPETVAMFGIHALAAFALSPKYFSWFGLGLCVFLYWLSIWLGIGVCYHRLLTHGSFETSRWFRYALTFTGILSWQGGPITWAGNHRLHHAETDTEDDLHSPKHGFLWSHMLWILFKKSAEQKAKAAQFTRDLRRDTVMVFLDRFFWAPQVLLTVALLGFGTWARDFQTAFGWVVWGVAVRMVLGYHATWFVNSAAHTWGYRSYNTKDTSKNLWWVALITGGEGWHNAHHAYPKAAAHGGQKWFEVDPTYWTIKLLEKLGLVWDVIEFPKNLPSKIESAVRA